MRDGGFEGTTWVIAPPVARCYLRRAPAQVNRYDETPRQEGQREGAPRSPPSFHPKSCGLSFFSVLDWMLCLSICLTKCLMPWPFVAVVCSLDAVFGCAACGSFACAFARAFELIT